MVGQMIKIKPKNILYQGVQHRMVLVVNFFVFMPPTLKKWGTYCFRLVRLSVCAYKPMGTPVAIKFGQLDTQVVIFEHK